MEQPRSTAARYSDTDECFSDRPIIQRKSRTFDMRGGRQQAKPDVGRPLDGRVRGIHNGRSIHCELMYLPFLEAYSLNTPTLVYPNFSCIVTEASFGSAMPTTAL